MLSITKKNIIIAGVYALVLALGIFLGQNFSEEEDSLSNSAVLPLGLTDKTSKLQRALQLLQQRYVDHVGIDTLQDFAIVEILNHLDPHSVYLPARKAEEMASNLAGSFAGIGAEVYSLNDTMMVTRVAEGGPAEVAGLRRGDKLMWINDVAVAGVQISHEKVANLIRGKRGTIVKVWLKRNGEEIVEPVQITRDIIQVNTIESAYMVTDSTGYIKIKQFGAKTSEEFIEALSKLKSSNPHNLIIDLRNNGGGYFFEAMNVLEQFLPEGDLMVYTKGVNNERVEYFSKGEGLFEAGKLAILIDENSASASEIVAGAIQDLNRGIVVGRRSFGKGLVQQKFKFGDGSAMNLSVARYFTPSGRSIQKPYRKGNVHYFNELTQRFLSGELTSGTVKDIDTIASDGLVYRTGAGKAMISEGGIMPDVYVKLDTTGANRFYLSLLDSQAVSDYVYSYMVVKPPAYSLRMFMEEYKVPTSVYPQFLALTKQRKLAFTLEESRDCRGLVEADMKATLARYYFGEDGYLRVKNASDAVIRRSIEALRNN